MNNAKETWKDMPFLAQEESLQDLQSTLQPSLISVTLFSSWTFLSAFLQMSGLDRLVVSSCCYPLGASQHPE